MTGSVSCDRCNRPADKETIVMTIHWCETCKAEVGASLARLKAADERILSLTRELDHWKSQVLDRA